MAATDSALAPAQLMELCRLELDLLAGQLDPVRSGLKELLGQGMSLEILREWALQLHLFDGFPTTIEALRLVAGLAPGGTPHAVADPDVGAGRQRGVKLFDRVYGHHGLAVRQALEQRAPVLVDWILEHGYGRVLSRPGLAASDREVLAVAILARKGWREQLRAHLRGAVACGADPGLLQEVLQLACTKGELRAESRALVDRLSR